MSHLAATQVDIILKETAASFPHEACLTCECFLGLVAQLNIDTEPEGSLLLEEYKVPRKDMHACLGCDPCPPGNSYAKYIRHKQLLQLMTV